MEILLAIGIAVAIFPVALLLFGMLQTFRVQHGPQQLEFLRGEVPTVLPDGWYDVSTDFYRGSWRGQQFFRAMGTGVNVFGSGPNNEMKNYPFTIYVGHGVQDAHVSVIKLDYTIPENPAWLRPLLQEIVRIGPERYLGKIHFRMASRYVLTLGMFTLQGRANAPEAGGELMQAPQDTEAPVRID